jgi:GNAT superfamily N-acetyltransferase
MLEDIPNIDRSRLDDMAARLKTWLAAKMPTGEYREWFAVDKEGRIVAGAGLWLMEWFPDPGDPSGRRGNIVNVYTDPAHRRRGLARRLMNTILDQCRSEGLANVILHASDPGRPLYESLGFKATREMRLQFETARKPRKRSPKHTSRA